jgi:hypothetical protein
LHQCIRPLIGAFAPGHHGYQRACVLISGQASKHLLHRAPPHHPIEGMPVQQDRARDGLKLLEAAQKSWRRLDGHNQSPKLVLGMTFNKGIEVIAKPADRQPATAAA